ncbi:MAG TPA: tyrosine-type recombinase/integrase [Clostridia bacterium]|nr:tyrosine-type recombinase/integrase [Clostridia bacterium]
MRLDQEHLRQYTADLEKKELAPATVRKYEADAAAFIEWADGREVDKGLAIAYKDHLKAKGFQTSTINNKIVTLNRFLKAAGLEDHAVKNIRVQTRGLENVMTQTDFDRIMRQAKRKGTARDVFMLEALYRTGLRVSELQFLTVDSLQAGFILVDNKGKQRKVPISPTLAKLARAYMKKAGITRGPLIVNRQGDPLSRGFIFKRLKWLAGQARVKLARAYPHSIRHLFAKNWLERNGAGRSLQLADILGHSSLETTRLYTRLTVSEARATMD